MYDPAVTKRSVANHPDCFLLQVTNTHTHSPLLQVMNTHTHSPLLACASRRSPLCRASAFPVTACRSSQSLQQMWTVLQHDGPDHLGPWSLQGCAGEQAGGSGRELFIEPAETSARSHSPTAWFRMLQVGHGLTASGQPLCKTSVQNLCAEPLCRTPAAAVS